MTPPPAPSVTELQDRHPALQGVELWHGCYSRALYAMLPDGHLAYAPEEHAEEFAHRLASALATQGAP